MENNAKKIIKSNLLQCPRDNNDKLFFTMMDYLNNLFTSKDPEDILRFYDYFENRDQLIKWMMERPKGNYRIVEFNKDENDIIVVIPTIDVNGKFAKTCREEIFKGLHIIFVESGGFKDYYFNFAHCVNLGIKKAMEYNPKWIIYSGDDMYKIDDVEILKNELSKIDYKDYKVVFAKESNYHTIPCYIYKFNYFFDVLLLLYKKYFYQLKIRKFKSIKDFNLKYWVRYNKNNKSKKILELINKLLYTKIKNTDFIQMVDFVIFSSNLFKKFENFYFDETFINAAEETDFSFKIKINKIKYKIINYQIGDFMGSSLGKGKLRAMRNAIGNVYFSYKFEKFYLDKLNK
jgi:hypothetical protein